jgi:hypothetical protein
MARGPGFEARETEMNLSIIFKLLLRDDDIHTNSVEELSLSSHLTRGRFRALPWHPFSLKVCSVLIDSPGRDLWSLTH